MRYYPVYLNLKGRRVVLIGAGPVALQKIPALLESEADVKIVAPEALDEIQELARAHKLEWNGRPYRSSALEYSTLVIAATDDPELHHRRAPQASAARTR